MYTCKSISNQHLSSKVAWQERSQRNARLKDFPFLICKSLKNFIYTRTYLFVRALLNEHNKSSYIHIYYYINVSASEPWKLMTERNWREFQQEQKLWNLNLLINAFLLLNLILYCSRMCVYVVVCVCAAWTFYSWWLWFLCFFFCYY